MGRIFNFNSNFNSKLDLNLSCAKNFRNQNSMVDLVYRLKKIVGSNNF